MPSAILFIALATIYYTSTNFDFSQALKLGTITGAIIGLGFSLFAALIILIIRTIRLYRINAKQTISSFKPNNDPIKLDPTLYEKKTRTIQKEQTTYNSDEPNIVEEKIMLLMDKNLTYETALISIKNQEIGNIIEYDKDSGLIIIHNETEELIITISSLTKHTSEILISSTLNNINIKNIISSLKEQEHSFMQY